MLVAIVVIGAACQELTEPIIYDGSYDLVRANQSALPVSVATHDSNCTRRITAGRLALSGPNFALGLYGSTACLLSVPPDTQQFEAVLLSTLYFSGLVSVEPGGLRLQPITSNLDGPSSIHAYRDQLGYTLDLTPSASGLAQAVVLEFVRDTTPSSPNDRFPIASPPN